MLRSGDAALSYGCGGYSGGDDDDDDHSNGESYRHTQI